MKFNIIGAGRLGKRLAVSLMVGGFGELIAVCNRSRRSAEQAIHEIGVGQAVDILADLPEVKLTFITASDDAIHQIAIELADSNVMSEGHMVVHCSGVLSSEALHPLHVRGCYVASIHPLKAFCDADLQEAAFQGSTCVVEGDNQAVEMASSLFQQMGAQVLSIRAEQKTTYHAAAVIASNYLVTLASCAGELFQESGLTDKQAKRITQQLMHSSLMNLQKPIQLAEALTGPLSRGDINTIDKHLQAIKKPELNALYRTAALATLPLIKLPMNVMENLKSKLEI